MRTDATSAQNRPKVVCIETVQGTSPTPMLFGETPPRSRTSLYYRQSGYVQVESDLRAELSGLQNTVNDMPRASHVAA